MDIDKLTEFKDLRSNSVHSKEINLFAVDTMKKVLCEIRKVNNNKNY